MNKPIKPNVNVPSGFATEGQKTDFTQQHIQNGFDPVVPDVLAGDNLNKFIDDTYKSITYSNAGVSDLYRSVVTYDANETYYLNSIVFSVDANSNVSVYISKADNNVGNALNNRNYWEEISLGGSRNLGEIVYSALPLTDAGLHLLDGSLLAGNGMYSGFVSYIADLYAANSSANYFTDETTWQNSVNTYGVCGKFVYNENNNTVRLPKVTGIVEGTVDINAIGDLIQAGLPFHTHSATTSSTGSHNHNRGDMEISGSVGSWIQYTGPQHTGGAFQQTGEIGAGYSMSAGGGGYVWSDFYASRTWSGNTSLNGEHSHTLTTDGGSYRISNTVQPQTVKAFVYIVVATSTKTETEVDMDEIATDVNGKLDRDLSNISATGQAIIDNKANINLNNLTNAGKIAIAHNASPSSTYTGLALTASGDTYIAPADGWVFVSGTQYNYSGYVFLENVSNDITMVSQPPNTNSFEIRAYVPVAKGQTFRVTYADVYIYVFRFIYDVGAESEAS